MPVAPVSLLPVVRVGQIPCEPQPQRWLVDQLWGAASVGMIGGAPKCAKTWLGLDLALSVATGTPCVGKYAVPEPGSVLVYLAEDALGIVRERVAGMARHRGLGLEDVPMHVITVPTLRLDRDLQVLQLLEDQMLTRTKLRDILSVKNERLGEVLEALEQAGKIRRTTTGWQRAS